MSWVTVIWSMTAAACLTLALMNFFIWFRQRDAWANLVFSLMAVSIATLAGYELALMRATTTAEFGFVLRWAHVPTWAIILSLVLFVRLYLNAGRWWLLWAICGVRTASLIINFSAGENLNYWHITELQHVSFFEEPVAVAQGVLNHWMLVGQISLVLLLFFVVDATVTVWRRGDRRRALVVGGSVLFFIICATGEATLVLWHLLHWPIIVSVPALGTVLAMSYELSRDAQRAAHLDRDLHESEQRMTLATEAVNLGVWFRDFARNEIWGSQQWRTLLGFSAAERLDFDVFLQRMHPDDRDGFRHTLELAAANGGRYEREYRVLLPDGQLRWIASHGRIEFNEAGKPARVRGVSLDITHRKLADLELHRQREELTHLSRVTMLGELSGSLAHELSQPLGAILRNAEAAELFLQHPSPDLDELRAIVADIRKDDERAGAVIQRMRSMLKRREVELTWFDLNLLVAESISLVRSAGELRKVRVSFTSEQALPLVLGDRVQLQQVLLNLLLNAMDAVHDAAPERRQVSARVRLTEMHVEIAVADRGHGIPADKFSRVFEPFFTTKTNGLGLGLPISRSIVEAHGGRLRAENNVEGGAVFSFTVPVRADASDHSNR